jgi:predicted transcriptional regulator
MRLQEKYNQPHPDRRNSIEIFHALLNAIMEEKAGNGRIRLGRLQYRTNIAYGRMTRYLKEMEDSGFITTINDLTITDKGDNFFADYSKINNQIKRIKKKYFNK